MKAYIGAVTVKAIELGAQFPHNVGCNWTYAEGFPNGDAARAFINWLDANGYEHQGIYISSSGGNSVRYRRIHHEQASK